MSMRHSIPKESLKALLTAVALVLAGASLIVHGLAIAAGSMGYPTCNLAGHRLVLVATDVPDYTYYGWLVTKYNLTDYFVFTDLQLLPSTRLDPLHDIVVLADPNYNSTTVGYARADAEKLEEFALSGGAIVAGLNGATLMRLADNQFPLPTSNCTGIIRGFQDYDPLVYKCLSPSNPIWARQPVYLGGNKSVVLFEWNRVILVPLNVVWAFTSTHDPAYLEILYHAICLETSQPPPAKPKPALAIAGGLLALGASLLITAREAARFSSQGSGGSSSGQAAGGGGGGSAASPAGGHSGSVLVIPPEYTRIPAEEALNHPFRKAIYDYLEREGAASFNTLWRLLGVSKATISWHLGLLSRLEIVRSIKYKREIYFYTNPARLIERLARTDRKFCIIARLVGDGWPLKEVARYTGLAVKGIQEIYEFLSRNASLLEYALRLCEG